MFGRLGRMLYFCAMKRMLGYIVFCLWLSTLCAQPRFRVMTWNLENLFDCHDDSLKQDEDFLPDSERQWTWGRYWRKIEDVSRVVMGIGENMPPALVALQEVENDSVLTAITKRSTLRSLGYEYVMTDSPDPRGVDVALMYQPLLFRLLGWESRRIPSAAYGLRPTRDLLHVWGRVSSGDTLHVIVCHLPSRLGGRAGKLNRKLAVNCILSLTDSLLACNPQCQIMLMGDFNATLRDKSLNPLNPLNSSHPLNPLNSLNLLNSSSFLPLTPNKKRPVEGTYRYKGNWSWIDHIMVSPALSDKASMASLYTQPWMQRPVSNGTWYPRRTYLGTSYNGGVSDHLPIYADLDYSNP